MKYFWIFCLLIHHAAADISWENKNPQGFSASAHYSKESLSLFEYLQVVLTLTYPNDYHPNAPEIRNHLFQNLGLGEPPFSLETEKITPPKADKEGFLTQTIAFELTPKITGSHQLTFMGIPFEPNANTGTVVTLMSGLVTITVTQPQPISLAANYIPPLLPLSQTFPVDLSPANREQLILTEAKKANEARRNVEIYQSKTVPWFSIALIIVAILYALHFIKKRETQETLPIKRGNPKTNALQKLQSLMKEQLPVDEIYLKLTSILNEFMEDQYHIKACTRTSEEVLGEIAALPLFQQDDNRNSVQEFLSKADKIKFGHLTISSEQTQHDLLFIQQLINKA